MIINFENKTLERPSKDVVLGSSKLPLLSTYRPVGRIPMTVVSYSGLSYRGCSLKLPKWQGVQTTYTYAILYMAARLLCLSSGICMYACVYLLDKD